MAALAGLFGNGPLNESLGSGFFAILLLTGGGRDGCAGGCFESACSFRDVDAESHGDDLVPARSLAPSTMLNSYCDGSGVCTANSSSKALSNGLSAVAVAWFSSRRSMLLDAGGCRAIQRVFGSTMRRSLVEWNFRWRVAFTRD